MTKKANREFQTPEGIFIQMYLYKFGINTISLSDDQYAMLASPEKALCDKFLVTFDIL